MLSYLINRRSLAAILSQKSQNYVLELEGKIGSIFQLEVQLMLTRSHEVVKVLIRAHFLKGEDALHYDKSTTQNKKCRLIVH